MSPEQNDGTGREKLDDITEKAIGCAYTVVNTLGPGFLEKVYENALAHELRKNSLNVCQQHPVAVIYDGIVVGDYTADLLVADEVIVELKSTRTLDEVHAAQCLNCLKANGKRVCLLLNFGKSKLEIKRLVNKF